MSLTAQQKYELSKAVRFWADNHPNPDEIFQLVDGGKFTPRQIADALEKETERGKIAFQMIELALTLGNSFDYILKRYYNNDPPGI